MMIARAGLAFLMLSGAALAQQPKIDCKTAQSNVELGYCAEKEFERADAELNRIFTRVLAAIDRQDHYTPEQRTKWKTALRETQRNWMKFKEQDCGELIGYEWSGGTGTSLASLGCQTEKTRTRTRDLVDRYEVK